MFGICFFIVISMNVQSTTCSLQGYLLYVVIHLPSNQAKAFCIQVQNMFVFIMLSRLFIVALWLPAVKRLTFRLSFGMFTCVFVTFPCGVLGQAWYLIVSILNLCPFLTTYLNYPNDLHHRVFLLC